MDEQEWLARQFEANRRRLRKIACRVLGSVSEVDDAVQESWFRVSRAGARDVENLNGWLTTIVGRVCLDMLRARALRREEPLGPDVREPVDEHNAERDALLADSVAMALLVVQEKLSPPERVSYVLHDVFDLPFDQIAQVIERSPAAARQLASRARRRIQHGGMPPDADSANQREIAKAFAMAARNRHFDALIAMLGPEVVCRVDHVAARSETAASLKVSDPILPPPEARGKKDSKSGLRKDSGDNYYAADVYPNGYRIDALQSRSSG